MTHRRPGKDILWILLDEIAQLEDFGQIDIDFEAAPTSDFRLRKFHPVSTDFGLDSLAKFLRAKLDEKNVHKEQLKADPHLAVTEAEREQLRKLVNSGRPIEVSIENGRLEVRALNSGRFRRSQSAPASEGDNETERRPRSRSTSASRSNISIESSRRHHGRLWDVENVVPSSSSLPSTQTNLYPASSNDDGASQFSGPDVNVPIYDDNLRVMFNAEYYHRFREPAREYIHIGPETRRRSTSAVNYPSVDAEVTSSNSQDPTNRGRLQQSLHGEDVRTTSFERHTRRNRNLSRRTTQDALRMLSSADDSLFCSSANDENDSELPRKAAVSIGDTQTTSSTLRSGTSSSLETISPDRLSGIDANDPILIDGTDDEAHFSTFTDFEDHEAGARRTIPDSQTLKGKGKGKDAFYSASSDDSSLGDGHEETIKDIGREENGLVSRNVDHTDSDAKRLVVQVFDYNNVVAEKLPADIRVTRENREKIWATHGLDQEGQPDPTKSTSWYTSNYSVGELNPVKQNIMGAPNQYGDYPREWEAHSPPKTSTDPPDCPSEYAKDEILPEILRSVCPYLSSQEVRTLRLVNRATAAVILPLMVRSTVVEFGRKLFESTDGKVWDPESELPAQGSMLKRLGKDINKFGITFDFDPVGLANAELKSVEEEVHAWFGTYTWPKEKYPHFNHLKKLEDLVDANRSLLRNTMGNLTSVHELAISVDSGHGWLTGPDTSDLAILRTQRLGGSKVFGKTYAALDKMNEFAMRQYFRWGQLNSLNACIKRLAGMREQFGIKKSDRRLLRRYRIRDYDDFTVANDQHDFNRTAHTGGDLQPPPLQPDAAPVTNPVAISPPAFGAIAHPLAGGWLFPVPNIYNNPTPLMPPNAVVLTQANALFAAMGTAGHNAGIANIAPIAFPPLQTPPPIVAPAVRPRFPALSYLQGGSFGGHTAQSIRHRRHGRKRTRQEPFAPESPPIIPQWPLLFSCYNLASEIGGSKSFISDEVASPADFPYMPGELNETQVQWLMETVWAQRAFLSAYTNSIINNAIIFKNVHALHIAKLSSGLIPSVAQDEFWAALPKLKNLTLMIVPDWREEHHPGDKSFNRTMYINPVQASVKLAGLLRDYVAKIENLSFLRTGFVGGGEHQTGMFARNQHVLPAPITSDPQMWLTDHNVKPDTNTMFVFNHVRNLVFENCWFSPCMLEGFMKKSRDTSLHDLRLDSVSLTGIHSLYQAGPLTTEGHRLQCQYSPGEWLQEEVPAGASWVNVLERITPGTTILERKYDAEMIDEGEKPRPEPEFRGNIKKIVLNSCGYVKISGVRGDQFSQSGLVEQSKPWTAVDEGLEARRKLFYVSNHHKPPPQISVADRLRPIYFRRGPTKEPKEEHKKCIMMSTKDPETQNEFPGLGKLTECVHPIEKRVLERAWGMRFGWGDDMERWAAVEDGHFEGGTGRFSGTIERE